MSLIENCIYEVFFSGRVYRRKTTEIPKLIQTGKPFGKSLCFSTNQVHFPQTGNNDRIGSHLSTGIFINDFICFLHINWYGGSFIIRFEHIHHFCRRRICIATSIGRSTWIKGSTQVYAWFIEQIDKREYFFSVCFSTEDLVEVGKWEIGITYHFFSKFGSFSHFALCKFGSCH